MIQAPNAAGPSRPSFAPAALAARAVEIGLVALLAWIAAQALWFAVYGTDALDLTVEAPAGAADPVQAGLDRTGVATGLFDALDGAVRVAEAVPETRLNMTLRGVRSGVNGSAVIETPNQGQRSIPVGGEIAPGVTLVAVEDERVIINRSGARESLFLTEAAARRAREQRDRPQPAPAPAVRSADAANVLSGQPDLELARQLDRDDWINGLRLEPALEGGRLTGMRVRDSSASDVLRASGLLPGDVITRLNGEPLTSADAAARALRGLESADRVAVTVRRDEEEIRLTAPLP
ncbi:MAG: PDZ domain-containing protein [Alphaproteobacteria bacterium]|nr:PDZ domain-containing protein [Alphaproteobacteria bacterium]